MHYKLSYTKSHNHFIDIEFTVSNLKNNFVEVQLPSWRPGRYELGNFSKNIQFFQPYDSDGNKLNFEKLTKDRWKIELNGSSSLVIKYNYYANELNAGSTYLDEKQLYVNPVNCFLYIDEKIDEKCTMQLLVPEDYKIAGALKKEGNKYSFLNFHELVDTPFIASNTLQHKLFENNGATFHLWFQGECKPNFEKIINDFQKYTSLQYNVMGGFPFEEYHYLYQITPYFTYHGVEHLNSTVCALGPSYNLMKKEIYDEFLGVSSHELFHAWNVKTIRPKDMLPYNYAKENYSQLGYVAEGVTTYYGDLFLYRSNVFSEQDFFKLFVEQIEKHLHNEARFVYSVGESSFDTWIDGYVKGIPNRKLSIYSDGCLLAFMVDVLVMKNTNNTKRLDDVMRVLFNAAKKGEGYDNETYKQAIEQVSKVSFDDFFNKYVTGRNSYEKLLKECLEYLGLKLIEKPSKIFCEARLGIKVDANNVVQSVVTDSISDENGIAVGDKILEVNGYQITNNLNDWLEYFKDDTIELIVQKKTHIEQVVLVLGDAIFYKNYELKAVETNNDAYKFWKS